MKFYTKICELRKTEKNCHTKIAFGKHCEKYKSVKSCAKKCPSESIRREAVNHFFKWPFAGRKKRWEGIPKNQKMYVLNDVWKNQIQNVKNVEENPLGIGKKSVQISWEIFENRKECPCLITNCIRKKFEAVPHFVEYLFAIRFLWLLFWISFGSFVRSIVHHQFLVAAATAAYAAFVVAVLQQINKKCIPKRSRKELSTARRRRMHPNFKQTRKMSSAMFHWRTLPGQTIINHMDWIMFVWFLEDYLSIYRLRPGLSRSLGQTDAQTDIWCCCRPSACLLPTSLALCQAVWFLGFTALTRKKWLFDVSLPLCIAMYSRLFPALAIVTNP